MTPVMFISHVKEKHLNHITTRCPAPHCIVNPSYTSSCNTSASIPLFLEHNHGARDAVAIRRQAVSETYQFCYQRGLREVWGYLWTSWYAPKVWKLWARRTFDISICIATADNDGY